MAMAEFIFGGFLVMWLSENILYIIAIVVGIMLLYALAILIYAGGVCGYYSLLIKHDEWKEKRQAKKKERKH